MGRQGWTARGPVCRRTFRWRNACSWSRNDLVVATASDPVHSARFQPCSEDKSVKVLKVPEVEMSLQVEATVDLLPSTLAADTPPC